MMYPAGAAVSQTVYVPGSTLPRWMVPAAALSSGAVLSVTESDPLPVKGLGVTLKVAPPSACWTVLLEDRDLTAGAEVDRAIGRTVR